MTLSTVIVTGVSRGLGEALAQTLLARGFSVIGISRGESDALGGAQYRFVPCDLVQVGRIAAALEPAFNELAGAKPASVTLINNAAVPWPVGVVGGLDMGDVQAAIATNITAPLALTDLFLRAFPDDGIGRRIINISSGAAQSPLAGSAVYSMSKAAIEMLTKAIAAEHNAPNFRCITLRPGIFETGMQKYMRSLDPGDCPSVALFRGFKDNGLLKEPRVVAEAIVSRLIDSDVEHGRTYTHNDLYTG